MKSEGNMVGHVRPGELRKRSRIQHEQERMALLAIEHHREHDALILTRRARRGYKHRLSWITPVFVPGAGYPHAYIDFDELIVPVIAVEPVQAIGVLLVVPEARCLRISCSFQRQPSLCVGLPLRRGARASTRCSAAVSW